MNTCPLPLDMSVFAEDCGYTEKNTLVLWHEMDISQVPWGPENVSANVKEHLLKRDGLIVYQAAKQIGKPFLMWYQDRAPGDRNISYRVWAEFDPEENKRLINHLYGD